jgi:hypothetical protein
VEIAYVYITVGTLGSVVVEALCCMCSRPDNVDEFFSLYLILLATLGPGFQSAANRNEYQKQKNNVSGE